MSANFVRKVGKDETLSASEFRLGKSQNKELTASVFGLNHLDGWFRLPIGHYGCVHSRKRAQGARCGKCRSAPRLVLRNCARECSFTSRQGRQGRGNAGLEGNGLCCKHKS
ncbi:hypothetical protein V565_026850 [Rhizoctonia solani 123E]|uniref:Uncharacterized protein n=1 Tax=Rhizoctonia solani 123E TaxID=1423351 RepID=A0A074S3F2_9AGAM|nr:hypothetical protein V565_026850 [Rhizoctonia solani 123E]